jgi:hypothetical protein
LHGYASYLLRFIRRLSPLAKFAALHSLAFASAKLAALHSLACESPFENGETACRYSYSGGEMGRVWPCQVLLQMEQLNLFSPFQFDLCWKLHMFNFIDDYLLLSGADEFICCSR